MSRDRCVDRWKGFRSHRDNSYSRKGCGIDIAFEILSHNEKSETSIDNY